MRIIRVEAKVACPVCGREKWTNWERKREKHCFDCPLESNFPPLMVPIVVPTHADEPAATYITRRVVVETC